MAIVKFTFDQSKEFYPEGAYCKLTREGDHVITIWEEHVGMCLHDREINGYDDSDFIMTIWDPVEKKAFDLNYATTRGWCYPSFASSVDASDEIRAEYIDYKGRMLEERRLSARRQGVQNRHGRIKQRVQVAKQSGLTYNQVKKIESAYSSSDVVESCFKLLTSKLRSKFRISLKEQLVAWAKGERGDYATPFSPKQLQYI